MKVTECLTTEHEVFLTQLGVLDRMARENVSADELRAVMLPIGEAVEKHRDAEETIFYPAILREFGAGFPPIQLMQAEHREIERCIRGVISRDGSIRDLVVAFVDVLQQHIAKEADVLFPMAEQRISGAELEQLARQCVDHYHQARV